MSDSHIITSLQHPLVKHMVKLRTDKDYRNGQKALVLEGLKPIQVASKGIIKILHTEEYSSYVLELSGEKWLVTAPILQKISGMTTPEGIVAEIRMPDYVDLKDAWQVLALDTVSDPGNMGTLLRTALALGWDAVFFFAGRL